VPGKSYYAHSVPGQPEDEWQPLGDHLRKVAASAAIFAEEFGGADEARAAGLLHDLGKYGDLFQRRLKGEAHGVDHWSCGAWLALTRYERAGVAVALAVWGHHVGLVSGEGGSLRSLDPRELACKRPELKLSEADPKVLVRRLEDDGLSLPPLNASIADWSSRHAVSFMLDVRMLYSALVDADFLDTERAVNPEAAAQRVAGPPLCPERALELVKHHVADLAAKRLSSDTVARLRADLFATCLEAGDRPQGVYTLSAPTGSGKTLSMLTFALRHAAKHGLRRVIVVLPYLTIIDQTVRVYRRLFDSAFGEHYVLEHHSLTGTRREDAAPRQGNPDVDNEDPALRTARLLAQNWDAPIIITTSVQFLESLFSNRSSACRKLHRIARSVVLFDEVQTLPAELAIPTLATLSRLAERYGTTVVFATATQPAFAHLDEKVRELAARGWQPRELVPRSPGLFNRVRRTSVHWPREDEEIGWEELADRLQEHKQVLCVVNIKRHAAQLARLLHQRAGNPDDPAPLFHLSTNMCPAHRENVLGEVCRRLGDGLPCRLVSTQCVEAGVDVDFPVVYRAWGPLEAIAQAAGRCNRNGNRADGSVHVFRPQRGEGRLYPSGPYEQAATVAEMLLKACPGAHIEDPDLYRRYYEDFYNLTRIPETAERAKKLLDAIKSRDFAESSCLYRLIPYDGINILVPYKITAYTTLAQEVRRHGLTAGWIRRARPHTISIFRPRSHAAIWTRLEPVRITRNRESDEWFIYLNEEDYDRKLLGLVPPHPWEAFTV